MNYRDFVLSNCPNFGTDQFTTKLGLGGMGLAGEAGEVCDELKKVVFHGKPINAQKIIEEMGDVRWYLEYLCAALGITMEDVKRANIKKLTERYPTGFSKEAANARYEKRTT